MYQTIQEPEFKAPIKTWLPPEEIEPGALDQLKNAAKHPDVEARHHYVDAMALDLLRRPWDFD